MPLLRALRDGALGVHFEPGPGFEAVHDEPNTALLVDRERGLGLSLHLADLGLDVRPVHEALWRRDVERHARALFEHCFTTIPRDQRPEAPRTADGEWSPVISTGRARVGAVEALTILHRLTYEPGHETVMGHVLVPLAGRTLELRVIQTAHQTGKREAVLLARAMQADPGADPVAQTRRPGQRHHDDPAHDAAFPGHPVTEVRAALAELVGGRIAVVTEPPQPGGRCELDDLGVSLVPPPGHAQAVTPPGGPLARFTRPSFSCTDGVRTLTLLRLPELRIERRSVILRAVADQLVRETAPQGATEVRVSVEELPHASPRVLAHLEYTTDRPYRTLSLWLTLADGSVLSVASNSETCVPPDELRADVTVVADSLQELAPPAPPPRPWWKFW
jgi:hypothetical protein